MPFWRGKDQKTESKPADPELVTVTCGWCGTAYQRKRDFSPYGTPVKGNNCGNCGGVYVKEDSQMICGQRKKYDLYNNMLFNPKKAPSLGR